MITSKSNTNKNAKLLRAILTIDYCFLKIDFKSFIDGLVICNMLIYNNENIIKK